MMPEKKHDITEYAYGLCSDPNALKAPQGALLICDNARIQRDGTVEPINGADPEDLDENISDIHRMINYSDDLILIDLAGYVCSYSAQDDEILDYDGEDFDFISEHVRGLELNGNLYIPTEKGVQKITSATDLTADRAGVLPHIYLAANTATSLGYGTEWLSSGNCAAYKATVLREDSNGNILESAPTNSRHVFASNINNEYGTGYVYLGSTIKAGDKIRLYRTIQQTAATGPANTFYHVDDYEVDSTDITAGYIQYKDLTPDGDLGATLYTDSSQYGYDQRNEAPPTAKEIASFNGHVFYSNYKLPDRATFKMLVHADVLDGDSEGVGRRDTTGDFTSGSADIANVANTTGLEIGQILHGDHIASDTYIIDIDGSTVTMSNDATGTETTDGFYAIDTIFVVHNDGYEIYPMYSGNVTQPDAAQEMMVRNAGTDFMMNIIGPSLSSGQPLNGDLKFDSSIVEIRAINAVTPWNDGKNLLRGFQVFGTHGEGYSPELVGVSHSPEGFNFAVGTVTSEQQEFVGNTMWSRLEMPEAVPEVNSIKVGDGAEILRTIPFGESIVFFTKSGLYAVYGSGGSFVARQHPNPGYVLVRPDAAIAVGDFIYAITNKGLVKITATEVISISDFFVHHEINDQILALASDDTETYGCWVKYSDKYREVYFGLPDAVGDDYTTKVYVYNTITQVFYTLTPHTSIYYIEQHLADSMNMYYAGQLWGNDSVLWADNDTPGGWGETSENIDDIYTAGQHRIRIIGYNYIVGDCVVDQNGALARVTGPYFSDWVTVDDASDLVTGPCKIYDPITSTVVWLPRYGPTRTLRKHFVAVLWVFEELDGLDDYKFTLDGSGQDHGPITIKDTTSRVHVPVSRKRKLYLTPGIFLAQPTRAWKLAGFGLEYYVQGPRGVKNAQT